jgi:nucleoside-diphosphate-sugar epimerase
MNNVLLTGSKGRMGSFLCTQYPDIRGIDKKDFNLLEVSLARRMKKNVDTVAHFAGSLKEDFDTSMNNMDIFWNILNACSKHNIPKLIIASSIRADELELNWPISYYGAAKKCQETYLRAWCAEKPGERVGIALRLGHFNPGGIAGSTLEELIRTDEAGLKYWFDLAISKNDPGFYVWNAIGKAVQHDG